MTSYETAQLLNSIIDSINRTENLRSLLSSIEECYYSYQKALELGIEYTDSAKRAATFEGLRESLTHAYLPKLIGVRSRRVYAELEAVLSALEVLKATQNADWPESFVSLANVASAFTDTYEEFLHDGEPKRILELINVGHDFSLSLRLFVTTLRSVKHELEDERVTIPPQYQEFSLFLSTNNNYNSVLTRLTTVSEMYSELCNLMGVSSAEYPLQIIKIETGSLLARIFGESRVVTLLIKLIESGASFMYRRFTTEGQIQSIPRQVEAIESVLHLAENLEKFGVDTTQVKDNLQKSSVIISNQLNDLLQGVASVKINDEMISVSKAFDEKFLREGRGLFLEDGSKAEGEASGDAGEDKPPEA